MRIETEQQALECEAAARFGATLSTDEFVAFWQDRKLRGIIYRKAWLCSKCKEDEEDLRQEGWAAICKLGPVSSFHMAERAAINAIQNVYQRDKRHEKYFDNSLLN